MEKFQLYRFFFLRLTVTSLIGRFPQESSAYFRLVFIKNIIEQNIIIAVKQPVN